MKRLDHIFIGLLIILSLGCDSQKAEAVDENVIARFEGGTITSLALDKAILALPPTSRSTTPDARIAWYERLARDMAVGKILIDEAKAKGQLEGPEFHKLAHHTARQIATADFLKRNMPIPDESPDEATLQTLYKKQFGEGFRPARALVSNIFLRYGPNRDKAAITQDLEALRQRVFDGENFGQLAAAHSDSESRHRDGMIGFIEKDQLPPDLQKVIFSLAENTPSAPIFTKDGGHLFFAESIIPEKTFALDEVRQTLLTKYWSDWRIERIRELAEAMTRPDPFILPSKEAMTQVLASGNSTRPLLTVGSWSITLSEFLRYVQSELGHHPAPEGWDRDLLFNDLEELALREWLYQSHFTGDTPVDEPDLAAYEAQRDQAWSEHLIRQALLENLLQETESLRPYYENHKARFQLPPKVRLKILTIPLSERASQDMAQLETQIEALRRGETTLEQLGETLKGKVTTTEAMTAMDIMRQEPRAIQFAFTTQPGDYAPPFRHNQGISLYKVEEQTPPQIQPFSVVHRLVAEDYLRTQGQDLYKAYASQRLQAANFQFFEKNARSHGQVAEIDPNSR